MNDHKLAKDFEKWMLRYSAEGAIKVMYNVCYSRYYERGTEDCWQSYLAAHNAQQAIIDMLMLEHCPDEITPEQLKEWEDSQIRCGEDKYEAELAAVPTGLQGYGPVTCVKCTEAELAAVIPPASDVTGQSDERQRQITVATINDLARQHGHAVNSGGEGGGHNYFNFTVSELHSLARAIEADLLATVDRNAVLGTQTNLPEGFVLLQRHDGKERYAACLDGGRFHGWLMWKHPDGQWVSERKLEPWEVMQSEDQRDDGIVHETTGEKG